MPWVRERGVKLSVESSGVGSGSSRVSGGDELGLGWYSERASSGMGGEVWPGVGWMLSDGGDCEVSCVERLCSGDGAENSGGDESGGVNIDGIEAVEGTGVGDGSA